MKPGYNIMIPMLLIFIITVFVRPPQEHGLYNAWVFMVNVAVILFLCGAMIRFTDSWFGVWGLDKK